MARFLSHDVKFGGVFSPRIVMPARVFTALPRSPASAEPQRDSFF
jgi:hypothetical protein